MESWGRSGESLTHGGSTRRGQRKIARPFDPKRPMHLVMKSTRATGYRSFMRRGHKLAIHALLIRLCERYDGKLYRFENVYNHLHLAIQFRSRPQFIAFMRVFAQGVMFIVTGARKGQPRGKFFDITAFTRIVNWGREWRVLQNYLWKNALESLGFRAAEIRRFRNAAKEVPL